MANRALVVGEPDEALAKNTVSSYYDALTRLMVVEDQPAWAPHLPSRSRVRTSPRRHFVDPSPAVAALRATPERLSEDLEVGALVEAADGRWAAFEIKLGSKAVDEGAGNLTRFAARVDTRKCGPPGILGVITGTGLAYARADGVAVIPVGTLGP